MLFAKFLEFTKTRLPVLWPLLDTDSARSAMFFLHSKYGLNFVANNGKKDIGTHTKVPQGTERLQNDSSC